MHQLSSPASSFSARLARAPSQPFVTYYDGSTGERSELSVRSLANWVAKTHFLLIDELGLGPGDLAFVALPAHWIAMPIVLGAWSAGLDVVTAPASANVGFVTPSSVAEAAGVPDVFAVDPEAAARGFGGSPPSGALDYVSAVRPQPDAWATVQVADTPSLAALAEAARETAVARGVVPGARLLVGDDWLADLAAVLAVGGSLVIAHRVSDVERIVAQERVTARTISGS